MQEVYLAGHMFIIENKNIRTDIKDVKNLFDLSDRFALTKNINRVFKDTDELIKIIESTEFENSDAIELFLNAKLKKFGNIAILYALPLDNMKCERFYDPNFDLLLCDVIYEYMLNSKKYDKNSKVTFKKMNECLKEILNILVLELKYGNSVENIVQDYNNKINNVEEYNEINELKNTISDTDVDTLLKSFKENIERNAKKIKENELIMKANEEVSNCLTKALKGINNVKDNIIVKVKDTENTNKIIDKVTHVWDNICVEYDTLKGKVRTRFPILDSHLKFFNEHDEIRELKYLYKKFKNKYELELTGKEKIEYHNFIVLLNKHFKGKFINLSELED